MKKALITGVNGQDGSYLSELLLSKGYHVCGIVRRASSFNTERLNNVLSNKKFTLVYGDVQDYASLNKVINDFMPDEIYNLAAQSHVKVSFDLSNYTTLTNSLGLINLLEIIRLNKLETKIYQASTSEMFGETKVIPQNEDTPFDPNSPYALSKLSAHLSIKNYRKAYGIFACGGILFNHESPRRGENFITRKTTLTTARIKKNYNTTLTVGNLNAKRDWGYAPEYVYGMWLMLQNKDPKDYVLATGKQITVREFIEKSFNFVGIDIAWEGEGINERGINKQNNKTIIDIDPKYFRPSEVSNLLGDATKAKNELKWKNETSVDQLIEIMIKSDLNYVD
jgi:GDPmannose 4,6-dehydratase